MMQLVILSLTGKASKHTIICKALAVPYFCMKMNKPKVLMFGWELPPNNSGGLGVACYGLAKGLSNVGVNISFALPRHLSTNIGFMNLLSHKLQGVSVTAINSLLGSYMNETSYYEYLSTEREENLKVYGKTLFDEAMRYGDMAASWARVQPHEIIHAHDWMTYPAGLRARKVSGKPFVAHIHATEYDRTGGRVNTKIAQIEYEGLNKSDKVIAVSNYTKKIVQRYYGVPSRKIEVVHNGVELSEFEPISNLRRMFPKDNVVLFVGRLTYQKGVEYLLQAAKKVLSKKPNTIFLVVGQGDLYEHLIIDAAKSGVAHRVVFTGFLTGDKLKACYQMADVFVMPSISEPYGIVALEALAAGTPAIISKQSGVAETLKNVHKVDFWKTEKMADLILNTLKYPVRAKEMTKRAKEEASLMTWRNAAQKTLAVYSKLV